MPYLVLAISMAITILGWRYLPAMLTPRGLPGIPSYSDPLPLLGDLMRLVRSGKLHSGLRAFFDTVGQDLGPIAQIRIGPAKRFIVLSDYQEIESVCNRHADFDRAGPTAEIFQQIIPTSQIALKTNVMWKHHRRLIGPAMTNKFLAMTLPRANQAMGELLDLFRVKIDKAQGRVWSAEGDMVAATMDVICGMAFGESWGIIRGFIAQIQARSPVSGGLEEVIFDAKMPQLASSSMALLDALPINTTFPRLLKIRNALSPTHNRHHRNIFGFLDTKIAEARERARVLGDSVVELADNTLDMMIAREMRGDNMSDAELRDEIFLYLVAGTETSAVTMSWWFKYMTNNPSVQVKLRQHLLECLPEPITAESLSPLNVPYLKAVVHETLRLSRTAGGIAREAKRDTVILGHVVPKGTTVIMPGAFHTETADSPAWRGDADTTARIDSLRSGEGRKVGHWSTGTGNTFDPERWIRDGRFDASLGPSAPFGVGQRGCFGKNLALLELRLLIARLCTSFFFAPVEERHNSMELYETITGHPRQSFIRPERWPERREP